MIVEERISYFLFGMLINLTLRVVFLFGVLINLTVRVDAYFHPIRMTYPIHPGPSFRAAPNWVKAAKHSLPQNFFVQDRRNDCPLSSIATAAPP